MEEMLRLEVGFRALEMTGDTEGGYLQKTLRRPSQYKLEVEVEVRVMHTL